MLPLFLALAAAIVYAAAVLLVKRAAELGAGVWRTAFVATITVAAAFQPLLLLGGTWRPELWWQPVVAAACFVAGQWFTFSSLETGDVSVATPVLGIKILLVAVLATLLAGETLRWQLWVAAVLATAAVALLNRRSGTGAHHAVGRTIALAGIAALAYALFDVLVQKWSPAWGVGRFLPATLLASGVFSLVFVARFRAPLSALPRAAWPWLMGAVLALAAQSLLFVTSIAKWGQVAAANVMFSSRGLWSVLFVWLLGHWVRSREQQLGAGVLGGRLAGATLMLSAIALVLL